MSVVYTVGYEGTDIDQFVATLKAVGVRRLADVRAIALSRKKGFSKKSLSARLEAEGIEYIHYVDLGDPKPGREAARAGLFDEFRSIYSTHLNSTAARAALELLVVAAGEKPTCLLCFERDPKTCHRSLVAQAMQDFETLHLFADDPQRYIRNAAKMPSYHTREGVAAA
ncbi:DUF488 domain-containing protein [Devosia sp. 2618]|uniref:DUF488 domain-containing protein n=1 Tax=Devosia sp. 2618 TaxID=3156454 RepID=UPI0033983A7B